MCAHDARVLRTSCNVHKNIVTRRNDEEKLYGHRGAPSSSVKDKALLDKFWVTFENVITR